MIFQHKLPLRIRKAVSQHEKNAHRKRGDAIGTGKAKQEGWGWQDRHKRKKTEGKGEVGYTERS